MAWDHSEIKGNPNYRNSISQDKNKATADYCNVQRNVSEWIELLNIYRLYTNLREKSKTHTSVLGFKWTTETPHQDGGRIPNAVLKKYSNLSCGFIKHREMCWADLAGYRVWGTYNGGGIFIPWGAPSSVYEKLRKPECQSVTPDIYSDFTQRTLPDICS